MIVEKIKIEKLVPATYNPRKELTPNDDEYKKIKNSILEFGYVDPIIINKDYTVIGGHQRLNVLKELGYKEVECIVVDMNKTKEKALNIALNKISGEWDNDKLEKLLYELQGDEYDVTLTGFDFDEVDDMIKDLTGSKEDDFDVDSAYESIVDPITKTGDVWKLGKHRLICGDSTNIEDVKKLMNNKIADLILTDPPYNVNYNGKTEDEMTIANDNLDDETFYNFLSKSFKNLFESVKEGGSIYVFHSDTEGLNFRNAFNEAGFKLAECLIWVKNTFVMGRQDYQWRHEPILYGWKLGAAHKFADDRTQSTVLEFDKPRQNELHPTMKPIDLLTQLIKNSSVENDLVLDLFGGSGSTLIAAEQINRICYLAELDPKYCDVIVNRWETLTGQKAELEK